MSEATMPPVTLKVKVSTLVELTKPRISILLLIIAVLSYFLALRTGVPFNWQALLVVIITVSTLCMGIFPLNHYMEREHDKLMVRTRDRPLPAQLVRPTHVLAFGIVWLVISLLFATLAGGWINGAVAAFVAFSYLVLYTPLKYKTAYHTSIGALSGATPPLIGWVVATGTIDLNAVLLFGVMFFWQFPHFLSIDMMYRDDYAKAGIKVLPVVDKTGRSTAFQVVAGIVLLMFVSVMPVFTGLARPVYGILAVLLASIFLYFGVRAVTNAEKIRAKHLLRASVLYLPLLFIALLINP